MYAQLAQALVDRAKYHAPDIGDALMQILQHFSFNTMSDVLEAGSTGATTSVVVMVAPCRMKVTGFKAIKQVVQTGTGNTPAVNIRQGASTQIATVASVALSGAIGDIHEGVLSATAANLIVEKGVLISMDIVNPAGTITVALKAKGQIEWEAIP